MKKIFTLAFSALTLIATAQTPGYTPTGVYDDVATSAEYDDGANTPQGIYWSDVPSTACGSGNISSTMNRNYNAKKMEYTLNLPGGGCWDPAVWVGFTSDNSQTGIDISAHKNFSVKFTNVGNTAVDVYVDLVDFAGKVINVNSNGDAFVSTDIAGGQTLTISFDLTGAYYNVPPTTYTGFDFTKVIGLDISVFNHAADVNWDPLALPANYQVAFTDLKVGKGSGVGVNEIVGNTVSVYPNPVQGGQVIFSQTLTNIYVYNAVGELVLSQAQATKLDVSSLSQGIYLLSSTQGTSKLVIE